MSCLGTFFFFLNQWPLCLWVYFWMLCSVSWFFFKFIFFNCYFPNTVFFATVPHGDLVTHTCIHTFFSHVSWFLCISFYYRNLSSLLLLYSNSWIRVSSSTLFSSSFLSPSFLFFFFFFFLLFRATLAAYGSSQARDQIRASAAAGPRRHSHSNARSKPRLWPSPDLVAKWILNPLSEARDQTHIFMDTLSFLTCWSTMGTPQICFSLWKLLCLF